MKQLSVAGWLSSYRKWECAYIFSSSRRTALLSVLYNATNETIHAVWVRSRYPELWWWVMERMRGT
jgi:hypothetical protein